MKRTTIRKQMQQALIVDNSRIAAVVGLDGRCSADQTIATSRAAALLRRAPAAARGDRSRRGSRTASGACSRSWATK